jgi:hypothetical protein|tara:strand:+ start:73 stop:177 length:105 start_codon:yes stop_codon:yes gene_type:complete
MFKKDEGRIFSTNELNDRNKGLQEIKTLEDDGIV